MKKCIAKGHGKRHVVCYRRKQQNLRSLPCPRHYCTTPSILKALNIVQQIFLGKAIVFCAEMTNKFITCPCCKNRRALDQKLIYLHFFIGGSSWYIAEFDGDNIFFGYAILNDDMDCAEWGYVSFAELKEVKVGFVEVDCELAECWNVKVFSEISIG